MPDSIPAICEEIISDWVGPRNLQLGQRYFGNEAVFDLRRQGGSLKACCQGSMPRPYQLRIDFGVEGIDEAHCSCPVGGGGHCKHIGALLLAWSKQPDAFREVAELDAALQERTKEELIALIKQMLQLQPNLETLLEIPLPGHGKRSGPVNPEVYRRQVASALRRAGDDWMALRGVAAEIGMTVSVGDGYLALSDFDGASSVYRAVVQQILGNDEVMADEDGFLCEVVDRCVEGFGNCLADAGYGSSGRETSLQTLFDIYRFDVDYGGLGLGESATDYILEQATVEEKKIVAAWVRAAMSQGSSRSDASNRQMYGRFLLDLEEAHLDDASFLRICRESGRSTDLVDRLLTLGRLEEAIAETEATSDYQLLTLAEVFRNHGYAQRLEPLLAQRIETSQDRRLAEWLKERHKERGETAQAHALARQLLERRPHLAGYQEVRELSGQLGVWEELRPQLLAGWSAAKEYHLLTDIHLEEGEIDLALESVKDRGPGSPYLADQMIRVALAASEIRPLAALDIYRQQAESLIEARGRENYQLACEHLTKVRDLYRQLSQDTAWADFIAGLRERHRRLPALKEELSNSGL